MRPAALFNNQGSFMTHGFVEVVRRSWRRHVTLFGRFEYRWNGLPRFPILA
jgi:hypothetical protein